MNWRALKTEQIGPHWWIMGDKEYGLYGPYKTKTDADEDRRGVVRTMTKLNDREFFTGEK